MLIKKIFCTLLILVFLNSSFSFQSSLCVYTHSQMLDRLRHDQNFKSFFTVNKLVDELEGQSRNENLDTLDQIRRSADIDYESRLRAKTLIEWMIYDIKPPIESNTGQLEKPQLVSRLEYERLIQKSKIDKDGISEFSEKHSLKINWQLRVGELLNRGYIVPSDCSDTRNKKLELPESFNRFAKSCISYNPSNIS